MFRICREGEWKKLKTKYKQKDSFSNLDLQILTEVWTPIYYHPEKIIHNFYPIQKKREKFPNEILETLEAKTSHFS